MFSKNILTIVVILTITTQGILLAQKVNPQQITVNGATLTVYNATAAQITNITNTLRRLPTAHIRSIPMIIANRNGLVSGGGTMWNADPQQRWIALSTESLNRQSNQQVNYTLLHETGHCVDYTFQIATTANRSALNQYLQSINYHGHTTGAGEGIAESYWRYFTAPSQVPANMRTILEQSTAWRNMSPIR
jgi:hypothetical protein